LIAQQHMSIIMFMHEQMIHEQMSLPFSQNIEYIIRMNKKEHKNVHI
jgi:hypothetical protein